MLPPGQYQTKTWPVLTVGPDPLINKKEWTLIVDGEVENPLTLTWEDFLKLPMVDKTLDFHCVTTWSLLGSSWTGVLFTELLKIVKPKPEAKYVLQTSGDSVGYTTGTLLENLVNENTLIGYKRDGEEIPSSHGGPVRLIAPQMYAYKSAKWLHKITFLKEPVLGFWEAQGYSEQANPWKEQRYSSDDQAS